MKHDNQERLAILHRQKAVAARYLRGQTQHEIARLVDLQGAGNFVLCAVRKLPHFLKAMRYAIRLRTWYRAAGFLLAIITCADSS